MAIKCENDDCENEATVHLTEIRQGEKREMHFCESCATQKGLPGKVHIPLPEILAGIVQKLKPGAQPPKARKGKESVCPNCQMTLTQFQAAGRFGCPSCYDSFKDEVLTLVEKIHESQQHVGKAPNRISPEASLQGELKQLQNEMRRAVKNENYEKAAVLRDKIRVLEESIANPATAGNPAKEGS